MRVRAFERSILQQEASAPISINSSEIETSSENDLKFKHLFQMRQRAKGSRNNFLEFHCWSELKIQDV